MVGYHRAPTPILANTHESRAFKLVLRHVRKKLRKFNIERSLDPFARDCEVFSFTNDIDPNTKAKSHMDALDFMKKMADTNPWKFDLIWFDPPFSSRQSNEIYDGHVNVYTDPAYMKDLYATIPKLLDTHGLFVRWGYNTNNPCPSILRLEYVYIFPQGANKNDVLVSIFKRDGLSLKLRRNLRDPVCHQRGVNLWE